ncbi:hypothetical protein [Streptomyces sp. NBRC 110035]|uniref:hypothetical protein n=1 Tax=Streptomyces sp. NBRC 110035 TaxID=1547867 RepID=UPI0005A77662|nr:hypothetical protein [Streptomyces sp. NBRC 110035]
MAEPLMTLEAAPLLGVPLPDPEPVPGCARCRYWDGQRSDARRSGDGARATDCNVHIRRHPH